jgi:hypothetical protein
MNTCCLCGGTITTCASCKGSCANPLCTVCRDADATVCVAKGKVTVTLPRTFEDLLYF